MTARRDEEKTVKNKFSNEHPLVLSYRLPKLSRTTLRWVLSKGSKVHRGSCFLRSSTPLQSFPTMTLRVGEVSTPVFFFWGLHGVEVFEYGSLGVRWSLGRKPSKPTAGIPIVVTLSQSVVVILSVSPTFIGEIYFSVNKKGDREEIRRQSSGSSP